MKKIPRRKDMNRHEAICFLKWLKGRTDICYACKDCLSWDECDLQKVIDLLEKEEREEGKHETKI